MTPEPITLGVHHVGLTVPNLAETTEFFVATLGFRKVGEKPDYPAIFVSDGQTLITLWQAKNAKTAAAFDRHNAIGLHHLAFRVAPENLDTLHRRLVERGVRLEFAPEPLGGGPTQHMICYAPGGVRMEFIAPMS